MIAGNLVKMVVGNTMRSRRHFVLSAFGIVIGVFTGERSANTCSPGGFEFKLIERAT